MEPEKFKSLFRRPKSVPEVSLSEVEYLDNNYKIKVLPKNKTIPTGLLIVAELLQNNPNIISFKFRWDEKDNSIDVDSYKNGEKLANNFVGHRSKLVSENPRIFLFDIRLKGQRIFKGKISVRIATENIIQKPLEYKIRGE